MVAWAKKYYRCRGAELVIKRNEVIYAKNDVKWTAAMYESSIRRTYIECDDEFSRHGNVFSVFP